MARTTTERALNPHGHVYLLDGLTKLHICKICGTCERRNGQYWWAGKWSKTERRAASIRRNSGTGITMQTPTTKTNHNRLQGGK